MGGLVGALAAVGTFFAFYMMYKKAASLLSGRPIRATPVVGYATGTPTAANLPVDNTAGAARPSSSGAQSYASSSRLASSTLPRRVSCSTWGAVFDAKMKDAEDASARVSMRPEAVPCLMELAHNSDLYLITRCDDDATEQAVVAALNDAGLFDAGLNRYKVLFCSTVMGKSSIVRQLEPNLHIDEDEAVISSLKPHIKSLALVVPESASIAASSSSDKVATIRTLEALFTGAGLS